MRVLLATTLVALVLAGCNSGGGDRDPAPLVDDSEFDGLDATPTTGVIRGVVVDDAIRPLEGVTITLSQTGATATTTAAGAFGFDGLQPGTYFLQATRAGYNTTQASADVVAGVAEPPLVRILLVADPSKTPFYVTAVYDGFIGCSARYFVEGRNLCGPAASLGIGREQTLFDLELDGVPSFAQGELVWESTQALGDELSFNWRRDDTNSDYIDAEGPSPLLLQANGTLLEENEVGAGQPLRTIVFTAHLQETEPPAGGLWGVGVQLQQQFQVYVHAFYNMVPPQDWRFSTHGEPPMPT